MRIHCPIAATARLHPERVAIRTEEGNVTYSGLHNAVNDAALRLRDLNVTVGSRVALLGRNSVRYIECFWALQRLGACAVPLNTRGTVGDIQSQLQDCRAELVLVDDELAGQIAGDGFGIPSLSLKEGSVGENLSMGSKIDPPELEIDGDTAIVYTSGSSGKPKGARLSVGNFYLNALGTNENLPLNHDDCWLLSLPLYHVGGLGILWRTALAGCTVYVTDRFDADRVCRLIASADVSHLSLVPTTAQLLLEQWGEKPLPASVKAIVLGGAPTQHRLLKRLLDLEWPVLTTYGLTEAASQVTAASLTDARSARLTAGRALRFREIRIVNEDGQPTKAGEQGELCVRGQVLFKGYLNSKEKTFDNDGWFHTGDIGVIDKDGLLTLFGRRDEMIISGGENIHPAEIETVVLEFEGVKEAKVVAIDDAKWGQRQVLIVASNDRAHSDLEALDRFLKSRLARYKLPAKTYVVDSLPRTTLGKIDVMALKRKYCERKN